MTDISPASWTPVVNPMTGAAARSQEAEDPVSNPCDSCSPFPSPAFLDPADRSTRSGNCAARGTAPCSTAFCCHCFSPAFGGVQHKQVSWPRICGSNSDHGSNSFHCCYLLKLRAAADRARSKSKSTQSEPAPAEDLRFPALPEEARESPEPLGRSEREGLQAARHPGGP